MDTGAIRSKKKVTSLYIHSLIVLALMFGFGYLPPIGGVTQLGMHAIGIFLGSIWGWCFVSLGWPSVMGLIAIGLSGYMSMNETLAAAFGASSTIQVFVILIFVAYMTRSGLSEYIARMILGSKICLGRPWMLVFIILFCSWVVSSATNAIPGTLLVWGFVYGALEECGFTKKDKFTTVILFLILTTALVGALTMPYNVTPLIFINGLTQSTGYTINYLSFFIGRCVCGLGFIVIMMLVVRFVIRPDLSKLVNKTDVFIEARKGLKMNVEQKIAAFCCLLFLATIFIPANLPKEWPVVTFFNNLGLIGCGILIIIGATIIHLYQVKNKGYKSIMDTNLLIKDLSWDIIFVLALTVPLTNFLSDDKCGVFDIFMSFFGPLAENVGPIPFVIISVLFSGIVTQLTHNQVLAAVLIPIVCPVAMDLGINPVAMMMCMMLPIQVAVCTPSASTVAAMGFGNDKWVDVKLAFIIAFICFLTTAVYSVLSLPIFLIFFN